MIRHLHFSFLCLAALQGGCTLGPDQSYVADLRQPADAEVLAEGMAEFVAVRLPATSSTVALDPTLPGQGGNALTPALAAALRQRGFAVAEGGQTPEGVHRLRYLVAPLDNGDLVRMTLDGTTEGARFFVRNTEGRLQSGGPYTVMQAVAAP